MNKKLKNTMSNINENNIYNDLREQRSNITNQTNYLSFNHKSRDIPVKRNNLK